MVEAAKQAFADEPSIRFYEHIDHLTGTWDYALASSSLQYVPNLEHYLGGLLDQIALYLSRSNTHESD